MYRTFLCYASYTNYASFAVLDEMAGYYNSAFGTVDYSTSENGQPVRKDGKSQDIRSNTEHFETWFL